MHIHMLPWSPASTTATPYGHCCSPTCSLAKLNAPLQTPTCTAAAPHAPLHPHVHHCTPHGHHCSATRAIATPRAPLQLCMPPCDLTGTTANPCMHHCSPTCPLESPQAPLQLHMPPCSSPCTVAAPCSAATLRSTAAPHHAAPQPHGDRRSPTRCPTGPCPTCLRGHHPASSPHPIPAPPGWALARAELSFNDGQEANATRGTVPGQYLGSQPSQIPPAPAREVQPLGRG